MATKKGSARRKKYVILSIDGGGIRGIIPATVLMWVETMIRARRKDRGRIGDYFDMIAGTSTGGILTCLYLAPDDATGRARYGAAAARDLYLQHGDAIFDRSLWQAISSLGGLTDEKYDVSELERVIRRYVGDLELADLIKPCLITGYDVRGYKPVFFTSHDAGNPSENYRVRDVARATSAAPTYFEPAFAESLDDTANGAPVIDGGVFANNPAACALVEALKKGRGPTEGVPLEDLAVLSLGTGRTPKRYTHRQCREWGLAQWARPLIGILMEGVSQTVHRQMQSVFESMDAAGSYLRIDAPFDQYRTLPGCQGLDTGLDCADPENMARLCTFGEQLAADNEAALRKFVDTHF